MSVSEKTVLLRRWYQEVWNERKEETIFELLDSNAEIHGHGKHGEVIYGPKEFLGFVREIRRAFPDTTVAVEEVFGDGYKVVARWLASGTHTGEGLGHASGRSIRITGTSIAHFSNGKIVAAWDNWDRMGMMEQIGAIPSNEVLNLAKPA
jgi:steroid delta-isomerase-like uncharacterized protein